MQSQIENLLSPPLNTVRRQTEAEAPFVLFESHSALCIHSSTHILVNHFPSTAEVVLLLLSPGIRVCFTFLQQGKAITFWIRQPKPAHEMKPTLQNSIAARAGLVEVPGLFLGFLKSWFNFRLSLFYEVNLSAGACKLLQR